MVAISACSSPGVTIDSRCVRPAGRSNDQSGWRSAAAGYTEVLFLFRGVIWSSMPVRKIIHVDMDAFYASANSATIRRSRGAPWR